MLKIEIKSPLVTEISGTSKAGKPYFIRKQAAWAHTYDAQGNLNPYPERIELSLNDGQEPFNPGVYTLSDKSFFVGDFGKLEVGRLILDPVAAPMKAAA